MFREVLAQLEAHRDKLAAAIDVIRAWADREEPLAPAETRIEGNVIHGSSKPGFTVTLARTPRAPKPRAATPARPAAAEFSAAREQTAARQTAILTYLRQHDGMAESKALQKAMPREPTLTDEQRSGAYRNTMSTLKSKGYVQRSGSVWSLTDEGRKAA